MQAGDVTSMLRVKYPATKPASDEPKMAPYLRLYARRKGIRGKLAPYPVLRTYAGGGGRHLTVSEALKLSIGSDPIKVRGASENAYRRYRLSRAAGSLLSAFGAVIGASLAALGALGPTSTTGKALVIAGGIVMLVAGVAQVVSSWCSPVE